MGVWPELPIQRIFDLVLNPLLPDWQVHVQTETANFSLELARFNVAEFSEIDLVPSSTANAVYGKYRTRFQLYQRQGLLVYVPLTLTLLSSDPSVASIYIRHRLTVIVTWFSLRWLQG